MKKTIKKISILGLTMLSLTISAQAQWTRNSGTLSTYLTNTGDNVGIGTTAPAFKLDVQSTGNASMSFKSTNATANLILDRGNSGNTASVSYRLLGNGQWQTGCVNTDNFQIRNISLGAAALVVQSTTSNVGIGTTSPSNKLSVTGNADFSGNVGIGTSSTPYKLTVASGVTTAIGLDNGASIAAKNSAGTYENFLWPRWTDNKTYMNYGAGGFDLRNSVSATTMYLTNSNNIGIGTSTSTTSRLTIDGPQYNSTLTTPALLQLGLDNGLNLSCDINQVQVRNNGSAGTLYLNPFGGNVGVGAASLNSKLTVYDPILSNFSLTGGGLFQVGEDGSKNIVMDNDQIQSRTNGTVSDLFVNSYGGGVQVGQYIGTVPTELEVIHNLNNGSTNGLRIRNLGTNNHYWTLYTTDANDNLEMNYLGTAKGNFNGVSGAYTAVSDRKFKKNLEQVNSVLDGINKLDVLKYNFNEQKEGDRKFFGMIAQDVEKVFPEVVFNNKPDKGDNYYTMDYSAFGVIAIKGLQEMSTENTSLKNEISDLKKQIADMNDCVQSLCNNSSLGHTERSRSAEMQPSNSLFQNQPNPFNQSTVIRYQLTNGDTNAKIIIRDLNGNLVKQINITNSGKGQVTINANELAQGTYTYTLEVNGASVDTKLMVVTK